jgi:hypothetical protein
MSALVGLRIATFSSPKAIAAASYGRGGNILGPYYFLIADLQRHFWLVHVLQTAGS